MKTTTTLFLSLLLSVLQAQCPDTLNLSGYIAGTYTAGTIILDSAQNTTWFLTLNSGCDCNDHLTPGIAVLKDSCIHTSEWISGGYADVLTDSAAFHSPEAMQLFHKFGVFGFDDCGLKRFVVKSLQIEPAGTGTGLNGGATKEFWITFEAEDYYGRTKEAVMLWRRVSDDAGCI